jgi:hypothetical protein
MKNQKLKEEFENTWIPTIERILSKEEMHLHSLSESLKENGDIELFDWNTKLSDLVKESEDFISYYKHRLKEYKQYAENL